MADESLLAVQGVAAQQLVCSSASQMPVAAVVALFYAVGLDRWGAQEGEFGLKRLKTVNSSRRCQQCNVVTAHGVSTWCLQQGTAAQMWAHAMSCSNTHSQLLLQLCLVKPVVEWPFCMCFVVVFLLTSQGGNPSAGCCRCCKQRGLLHTIVCPVQLLHLSKLDTSVKRH